MRLVPRTGPDRGGDARVSLRNIPWIFRNEAANVDELRALGKPAVLVNVVSDEGRELGTAVCNLQKGGATGVNILARMLADNVQLPVDRAFFSTRINKALQHRQNFFRDRKHYRLLNAEGDMLPGIVCDRYDDVLCVQFSSAAMEILYEDVVVEALQLIMAPRAIIVRYDGTPDRQLEMAQVRAPIVARGHYDSPTVVPKDEAGGLEFELDLLAEGVSSGRFLADRALRDLVAGALRGPSPGGDPPRVLSLFGESVGVACAVQGAHVHCAEGLGEVRRARTEALALRNGCSDRVEHFHISTPQAQLLGPERLGAFDVVTLEPPALAPTYGKQEEGMQQYTAWVATAAAALKPGGLLLVACRSRTMKATQLMKCANLGIWSARRRARLTHRSCPALGDFPVHLALPTTNEMQVVALRMIN